MDFCAASVLTLTNFRSFTQKHLVFDPQQTLILGNNGRGKSNILEALSLLSTGKSFQGKALSECVHLGSEAAHLEAVVRVEGEDTSLKLAILAKTNALGERTSSRYQKNGTKKRKGDVVGILKSVVFRPEDLELITGSPSAKRGFLDEVAGVHPAQVRSICRSF